MSCVVKMEVPKCPPRSRQPVSFTLQVHLVAFHRPRRSTKRRCQDNEASCALECEAQPCGDEVMGLSLAGGTTTRSSSKISTSLRVAKPAPQQELLTSFLQRLVLVERFTRIAQDKLHCAFHGDRSRLLNPTVGGRKSVQLCPTREYQHGCHERNTRSYTSTGARVQEASHSKER
jgi:hypothetical protein